MGPSMIFRCEKCGFESWLNLRQPSYGMMAKVWEWYCLKKREIVRASQLNRETAADIPTCCRYCRKRGGAFARVCSAANIKKLEPLCPTCQTPLVADGEKLGYDEYVCPQNPTHLEYEENILYRCPVPGCGGILRPSGKGMKYWD